MNIAAELAQQISTELTDTIDRLDRLSTKLLIPRKVNTELYALADKVHAIRTLVATYIDTYAPANKPA